VVVKNFLENKYQEIQQVIVYFWGVQIIILKLDSSNVNVINHFFIKQKNDLKKKEKRKKKKEKRKKIFIISDYLNKNNKN
jgi:hypothetical protein